MESPTKLDWLKEADAQLDKCAADFRAQLELASKNCADVDDTGIVLLRHVEQGLEFVFRSKLCGKRWHERPDFESSLGLSLIGFSLAQKDMVELFVGEPLLWPGRSLTILLFFVSFLGGSGLYIHGKTRTQIPDGNPLWSRAYSKLTNLLFPSKLANPARVSTPTDPA